MSKRVVIVGAGVVGLMTAWYCRQQGHDVLVIERNGPDRDGCSFGNAGMIVPSHFVPLAAPGMVRLGLRWLWNPSSPLAIRLGWSGELWKWLWQFQRHCTKQHVEQCSGLLRDMHLASRELYCQLHDTLPGGIGLQQNGLLMLCRSREMLHEETSTAQMAKELGIDAEPVTPADIDNLEPALQTDVIGGVFFPQDCHLNPNLLMRSLQSRLVADGVNFQWHAECRGMGFRSKRVHAVETNRGTVDADEVVLCGGVGSTSIARIAGLRLPIQPGKGYAVNLVDFAKTSDQPPPRICSILTEARVAVTPMDSTLRFAGTMEIGATDMMIRPRRIEGIIRAAKTYYPSLRDDDFENTSRWATASRWAGLRPCTPDGMPYLGRSRLWENVTIATGHAMLGVSLAPVSGQIISNLIDGIDSPWTDHPRLSPDRFG